MARDLTPLEVREALVAFCRNVGAQASVSASIQMPSRYGGGQPESLLSAYFYAKDLVNGVTFVVYADDWRGLTEALKAKWAEFSEEHERRIVRDMALAIIRITADIGECSDAALRTDKFCAAEVIKYGERACADATEIAGLGPFSIVTLGSANALARAS